MIRAHIIISGFVQGVGFRYFVKRKADELGLSGWVKNTPDGNVEAIVEGIEDDVKKLITNCRKGPFLANVSDVKHTIDEALGDVKDFTIRY